jgi:Fe-S cluster assembly ATP-binding protein
MESMIEVKELTVRIGEKRILREVNLRIAKGEAVVLFGPNGCGKTSLLKAIMGGAEYRVESGKILFAGKDITGLPMDERARLGIGIAFQRPPAVRGVKLGDLLRICGEKSGNLAADEIPGLARKLHLHDFLERDINLGFSGGEIKRSELLQLIGQNPTFIMLDEPDSGVDLVNIHLVGQAINALLEKEKAAAKREKAGLIVTHSGYILDYVNADRAYVMLDGTVYCSGNPRDLLEDIRTKGYEGCVQCRG